MFKKGSLVEGISIRGLTHRGLAFGFAPDDPAPVHFDSRTVAPDDVVSARILGKQKRQVQARVERISHSSEWRRQARCRHFGVCGGCDQQHVELSAQHDSKTTLVRAELEAVLPRAVLDAINFLPMPENTHEFHYRNKMEFTFSRRAFLEKIPEDPGELVTASELKEPGSLGLFVPRSGNKVLDVQECLLQHEIGDRIRNRVREMARDRGMDFYDQRSREGLMRTLLIRRSLGGDVLVMIVVARPEREVVEALCADLSKEFPEIRSLWWMVNDKANDSYADIEPVHFSGEQRIKESFGGMDFLVGPKTFFQVNSEQAEILLASVLDAGGIQKKDKVWDLYCGVGTLSAAAARKAAYVYGIESVQESVDAARENCARNGIENAEFFAGDTRELISDDFLEKVGRPDLVIVDPPRAGLHPKVSARLAAMAVPCLVYVSCNPNSLARDLAVLSEAYEIQTLQPIDLMPQTHQVEVVCRLVSRENR